MSAAAHFVAFLFAAPAGALTYTVVIADYPFAKLHHVLLIVLLFIFPLIGIPDIASATVFYYIVGIILAGAAARILSNPRHQGRHTGHQQRQPGEPSDEPIIFTDQREDR